MNTHLDDGQLRAALDGELTPASLAGHLEHCPDCLERIKVMRAQLAPVSVKLDFLSEGQDVERQPTSQTALRKFYTLQANFKENSMLKRLFAAPAFRVFAVAALALALIIAIPSTRALADELLSMFRVQQVTIVPVDFTGMQQLTGNTAIGRQVSALISDSTVVTQESGGPQTAADSADASQKSGYAVRLPGAESPAQINVMGASSFEVTVNREKAQALLDEAGRSDLVLPEAIDGAVIKIHIPASVSVNYGECPLPSADGMGPDGAGSMGRQYPDCLIFSELPSPLVTAPAGVDVAQLAQIGFEFSGMTSEQAAAFTSSVDWTTTLVVPIPRNAATYKQVSVDGVSGTLIQRPADDAPQFVLVWVKDGMVYAIAGLGADSQRALDLANSLP